MKQVAVNSTGLRSVGYRPSKHTLEIEFHSGRLYRYFRVPEAVYQALMAAESLGRYFNAHIRRSYSYRRLR
jgi:hypothetical protein